MMLVIFWPVNGVGFLFNPNFLARTMFKLVNPRQLPHNNLNCQEMEPRMLHGKFFFFFLFYFFETEGQTSATMKLHGKFWGRRNTELSCSWTWSCFCIVRFRMNGACLIFTHYFMKKVRNPGAPRSTMEGQTKDGSALTGLTTGGSRATTFCNACSFVVGFPTIAATLSATSTVRSLWGAMVVELQKARTLVTKPPPKISTLVSKKRDGIESNEGLPSFYTVE